MFENIGLTYQFALGLVVLIVATFAAAFLRLFWLKRRLARYQKKNELDAAERATQMAVMAKRVLSEGDLFGVRAIENGFYGGVAQSAPTSVASSPQLSPVSTIIDSSGSPISFNPSLGTTISELSLSSPSLSRVPSNSKSPQTSKSNATLRLQPSDAELSGRRNHDPAVALSAHKQISPSRPGSIARSQSYDSYPMIIPSAAVPSNLRPCYDPRLRSYAQWRLSADIKRTARTFPSSQNIASCTRPKIGSIISADLHPQIRRRRSRSLSSMDASYIRSLQEVDAKKAPESVNSFAEPFKSLPDGNVEPSEQTLGRPTPSHDAKISHNQRSSALPVRSIKRTRDSLRRIRRSSTDSNGVTRRPRPYEQRRFDSRNHQNEVHRAEFNRTRILLSKDKGSDLRDSSPSWLRSSSNLRPRSRLSNTSSAPLEKWEMDIPEPMPEDWRNNCRRAAELEQKHTKTQTESI